MTTQTKMTVDEFCERYDHCIEAECVDGFYRIKGSRKNTKWAMRYWLSDRDVSISMVSDVLMGWGDYNHYLIVNTGARSYGLFARLSQ